MHFTSLIKNEIRESKVGEARLAHQMDEVLKSFESFYGIYEQFINIRKLPEAQLELDEQVSILDLYSFSENGGVLSPLRHTSPQWINDRFSVFTAKPLYLLHLGISKKFKECTFFYLSVLNRVILFFLTNKKEMVSCSRTQQLNGRNILLFAY